MTFDQPLVLKICGWKREADGKCATPRFADERTKIIKESLAVVEAAYHVLVANENADVRLRGSAR